ncbi:MAG: (d)CMP kinase [Synergistaceae bacterium]|jgi:cytidylate kinase|nr:(d)CMP kinase [Synergistaceae bacterium]
MTFVVTIDGPSGAGKSSVAKALAKTLGIRWLDTGALYRAVAYTLDKRGIARTDGKGTADAMAALSVRIDSEGVFVDGEDVTKAIRTPHVDRIVSAWAALGAVRNGLLSVQRSQARYGSLVAEGRDMGSVVFPDAAVRFFLTASPEARAMRRYKELLERGESLDYEDVLSRMRDRDRADSSRDLAPLTEPEGAIRVDTSSMGQQEVVDELVRIVRSETAGCSS